MSRRPGDGGERHRARSRARAWALQVHYRWEADGRDKALTDSLNETLETRYVAEARRPYLRRLIQEMDVRLEAVDRILQENLENWRLDRLASIDRGVLRIGATEMLHMEDIPPKVGLKEAIRLAERYGGDESAGFVNGVLDALLEKR